MARPTVPLPRWGELSDGTPAVNLTEPLSGQKDTGYPRKEDNPDGHGTIPSSGNLNWILRSIFKWVAWAGKGAPVDSDDLARLFEVNAVQASTDAHISDASAAHAASAISVSPAGAISSTDVQAALVELDTEKSPTTHNHAGVYAPLVHNHDGVYVKIADLPAAAKSTGGYAQGPASDQDASTGVLLTVAFSQAGTGQWWEFTANAQVTGGDGSTTDDVYLEVRIDGGSWSQLAHVTVTSAGGGSTTAWMPGRLALQLSTESHTVEMRVRDTGWSSLHATIHASTAYLGARCY